VRLLAAPLPFELAVLTVFPEQGLQSRECPEASENHKTRLTSRVEGSKVS
jgi:hypothetical protein